ncbi:MAG: YceD family protein [Actinobacteria bacterium]|nr:YceD family protein [Actinomycetota bacterium]
MVPRPSEVYLFSSHDLPRRSGEMREYSFDITVPERVGIDVIAVLGGEDIHIEMRLESVSEGVLVSADISAIADGECMRCLEPIELDIDRRIQELYRYEPQKAHTKAERKRAREEADDLDDDDDLMMDGDFINLETPIRDAIVLDLPINPLCTLDCAGLCAGCGVKWSLLPSDHAHELIDPRWAGLPDLGEQ